MLATIWQSSSTRKAVLPFRDDYPGVRRTDMVDRVTSERRSEIMRSVGQKDTGAEMKVRRALHLLGYRYRLHRRELPGKPDIVFPSRRKTVFVHGCRN